MILCSCTGTTDTDVEVALISIMREDAPPLPTPGVVYRELGQKLKCCGCAPLLVEVIYDKLKALEVEGRVCPYRSKPLLEWLVAAKARKVTRPVAYAPGVALAAE